MKTPLSKKTTPFLFLLVLLIGLGAIIFSRFEKRPAVAQNQKTPVEAIAVSPQASQPLPETTAADSSQPVLPRIGGTDAETTPDNPQSDRAQLKQLADNLKDLITAINAKEAVKYSLKTDSSKTAPAETAKLDSEIDSLMKQRRAVQEQMRVLVMNRLGKN